MDDKKETLSEKATQKIERPPYWRDPADIIISNVAGEFESALFSLQNELDATIEADSENPHFKSKFASFSHTLAMVRKACKEHGFTIRQFPGKLSAHGPETKRFYTLPICTKITHVETMQAETIIIDIPVDNKAVSYGAALTFGKRYALQSYFGIASTDSDSMTFIQEKFDFEAAEKTAAPLIEQIEAAETTDDLDDWLKKNEASLKLYGELVLSLVRSAYASHLHDLKKFEEEKPKTNGRAKKQEVETNAS